jgi:hypothetical protein
MMTAPTLSFIIDVAVLKGPDTASIAPGRNLQVASGSRLLRFPPASRLYGGHPNKHFKPF